MADSEVFKSKDNGSLYIQPDGPNTKPEYLPCHDLEDIAEANGSITLIQCINERGEFETIGATVAPPEPTTTTLGTYIGKVADWIETVRCPFGLYVMLSCGKKGIFSNWERAMLVQVQHVTGKTRSGLVRKDQDTPAMHTFDVEASPGVTDFYRLSSTTQAIDVGVDTGAITSLRFLDDVACWGTCGDTVDPCSRGIMTTAAQTDTFGKVLLSPEWAGASEWTITAADPFGANEDIADGIIVQTGRSTLRIIVVRGTTDASNPAEIAYSDDLGATWTLVDVGATNGEFAIKKGALFAVGVNDIYLVTDGGRIYKSEDGGLSWTAKEDANITSSAYNYIYMLNSQIGYAVGASGLVVKTLDGGKSWGQTGAAAGAGTLYSVGVLGRDRLWVGGASGVVYYSTDGGTTWGTRTLADVTANVNDMSWKDAYHGYVANGETVQFTIDGGYSWDTIPDTGNLATTDLVSVNYCTERQVFSASEGEVIQSTV